MSDDAMLSCLDQRQTGSTVQLKSVHEFFEHAAATEAMTPNMNISNPATAHHGNVKKTR